MFLHVAHDRLVDGQTETAHEQPAPRYAGVIEPADAFQPVPVDGQVAVVDGAPVLSPEKVGEEEHEQSIGADLVGGRLNGERLFQGLDAGRRDAVNLLARAALLRHLVARHQTLGAQFAERRVYGTESGMVKLRERPFLEGLLDLVSGGVAHHEHAKAQGARVHEIVLRPSFREGRVYIKLIYIILI